jgi:hypothetical protein
VFFSVLLQVERTLRLGPGRPGLSKLGEKTELGEQAVVPRLVRRNFETWGTIFLVSSVVSSFNSRSVVTPCPKGDLHLSSPSLESLSILTTAHKLLILLESLDT